MGIKLVDFTISENESALTQTNMAMTSSEKIILQDHHHICYYSSIKTLFCNEWLYATGNFYVDYILKWWQLQYTEWHCIVKMNSIPYFHHFSVVTNMLCIIFLLNKSNHRNQLWRKWGMTSGSLRAGSSKNQACMCHGPTQVRVGTRPPQRGGDEWISYTTANICLKNQVVSLCAALKSTLILGYVTSYKGQTQVTLSELRRMLWKGTRAKWQHPPQGWGQLNDALKASIGTLSFSFTEKDLLIILSKAFAGESRLSPPLDMDFFGICLSNICRMPDTGERVSS